MVESRTIAGMFDNRHNTGIVAGIVDNRHTVASMVDNRHDTVAGKVDSRQNNRYGR